MRTVGWNAAESFGLPVGGFAVAAWLAGCDARLTACVFLLLAVSLGALLAIIPLATYVLVWAAIPVVLIAAGITASAVWLRPVLHRLSIGLRFAPAITA